MLLCEVCENTCNFLSRPKSALFTCNLFVSGFVMITIEEIAHTTEVEVRIGINTTTEIEVESGEENIEEKDTEEAANDIKFS